MTRFTVLIAALVMVGCSPVPTTMLDAGTTRDAGTSPDAGTPPDAGTTPDAGTFPNPLPCTAHVGTGTGSLDIQQGDLVTNDVLCITAGTYDSLNINSVTGVTIQNDGLVTIPGPSSANDLRDVVITGTGTGATASAYGIHFRDISYRALQLNGAIHSVTLQYLEFTNIGDYTITVAARHEVFDGGAESALTGFKVLHNRATHFGPSFLQLSGTAANADLIDITLAPEIAFNELNDAPHCGYGFWLGTAFDVDVHHNRTTGLGLELAQHNGIVFLNGDGRIHHNAFRNYLGEGLRLWPFSYGAIGTLDVFDNLFLESQKYSAVEVQAFDADVTRNAQTHFTNVRIFNNTCGNLNRQTMLPDNYVHWFGAILDSYGFAGGTVELTNNLAFNIGEPKHDDFFVNVEGNGVALRSHNLYFADGADAGLVDEIDVRPTATSPVIGAGVTVTGLGLDFYGRPHGNPPEVGAVGF